MPTRHPPPQEGTATPGTLRVVSTTLHHATAQYRVPSIPRPPAAIPVPEGPSQAAAGSPLPPEHLGGADAPLNGAMQPGASPTRLAHPCEPSVPPPPRLPRTGQSLASVACALHALGERPPQPPQLGGHPHGVLPPLDGYGGGPHMGGVGPAARSPGPGGVGANTPRGPRLAVWSGSPALAVPPPPLEGWHAARSGGPFAGAPLGPGSPPRPLQRGRHPAGLDQRPPAAGCS